MGTKASEVRGDWIEVSAMNVSPSLRSSGKTNDIDHTIPAPTGGVSCNSTSVVTRTLPSCVAVSTSRLLEYTPPSAAVAPN
eukprot:1542353-Rhodomonas_salina.1